MKQERIDLEKRRLLLEEKKRDDEEKDKEAQRGLLVALTQSLTNFQRSA